LYQNNLCLGSGVGEFIVDNKTTLFPIKKGGTYDLPSEDNNDINVDYPITAKGHFPLSFDPCLLLTGHET